jgi:hypothetical protein
LALALAPSAAAAQNYQVIGPGTVPCGTWTEQRRIGSGALLNVMEAWVEGYISAMNAISAITGHGSGVGVSEADGMYGWIDNYCAAQPLDHLSTATVALLHELTRRGQAAVP